VAIICPSPLTFAIQRPITASHSSRHDMLAIISPRYQYGPFLFFLLQKLCQITWLDRLKISFYFRRPPFGLRPVAFATSATWLIRHWTTNQLISCIYQHTIVCTDWEFAAYRFKIRKKITIFFYQFLKFTKNSFPCISVRHNIKPQLHHLLTTCLFDVRAGERAN